MNLDETIKGESRQSSANKKEDTHGDKGKLGPSSRQQKNLEKSSLLSTYAILFAGQFKNVKRRGVGEKGVEGKREAPSIELRLHRPKRSKSLREDIVVDIRKKRQPCAPKGVSPLSEPKRSNMGRNGTGKKKRSHSGCIAAAGGLQDNSQGAIVP